MLQNTHVAIGQEIGIDHHLKRDSDSSVAGYIIMGLSILMEVNEMNVVQEKVLKAPKQ